MPLPRVRNLLYTQDSLEYSSGSNLLKGTPLEWRSRPRERHSGTPLEWRSRQVAMIKIYSLTLTILEPAAHGMGAPQAIGNTQGNAVKGTFTIKPGPRSPGSTSCHVIGCLFVRSPPPTNRIGLWYASFQVSSISNHRLSSYVFIFRKILCPNKLYNHRCISTESTLSCFQKIRNANKLS